VDKTILVRIGDQPHVGKGAFLDHTLHHRGRIG